MAGSQGRMWRTGSGLMKGQSVSSIMRSSGVIAADCRATAPFLKVTMPVKEA